MIAILDLVRTALRHWRLLGVIGIVTLLGWQTMRLHYAQLEIKQIQLQQQQDAANSLAQASQVVVEATEGLLNDEREDAPIMERVVTRVRNVCMYDADENGVPLPRWISVDDRRPAHLSDEDVRELLIRAVEHDLRAFAGEANERRRLNHVLRSGGLDDPVERLD